MIIRIRNFKNFQCIKSK